MGKLWVHSEHLAYINYYHLIFEFEKRPTLEVQYESFLLKIYRNFDKYTGCLLV